MILGYLSVFVGLKREEVIIFVLIIVVLIIVVCELELKSLGVNVKFVFNVLYSSIIGNDS